MLIRRLYLGYVLVALILYILIPFDIVPETVFGILGLVDDILIVFILVFYVTFMYRAALTER